MTRTLGRLSALAASVFLLLLLPACISPPRGERKPVRLENHLPAEAPPVASAPPAALPPQVASALLPPVMPSSRSVVAESRFDVDARNTPAREFFLGLVAGTPVNMVLHPAVKGEITVAMKNVTVNEVLSVVHSLYGYEFRRTESGYLVLPGGLQTRIFQVDYLNLSRRGISQTRISSGQVSESRGNGESRDGSGNDKGKEPKDRKESISGSRIDTESSTDLWQELEIALRAMVGIEDGRRVVVQPQAGLVVIRALPGELLEIERYIEQLQGSLHRQVILEAKVLEVELRDGFQSGINWALLLRQGAKSAVLGQTGGGSIFNNGFSEIAGNSGRLNPLAPQLPEGTDTSAFGGIFSTALSLGDFTAFIELLQTQGDVQVLSSPRVSTMNNQKAVIKVGSDEFFVTDISNDTVVGTTTTLSTDVTLTPFFSGIALDVTPQIGGDGRVTLHIHPTISEVTDQSKVITIGRDTQTLPLAFSKVRESDSIVSADSGQVVVIGGLMENRVRNENASVPLLGAIPLLGHFFQHKLAVATKSELVILLRPVVVQNRAAWNTSLNDSRREFEKLGESLRDLPGTFSR